MDSLPGTEIRILNKNLERGRIKYAIFDFDGTISILRRMGTDHGAGDIEHCGDIR